MGCCLGAVLLAGAPRLALALWWFFDPARVEGAFNWTTVIGGWTVPTWLWAILVIALLIDLGAVGGGREAQRRRA